MTQRASRGMVPSPYPGRQSGLSPARSSDGYHSFQGSPASGHAHHHHQHRHLHPRGDEEQQLERRVQGAMSSSPQGKGSPKRQFSPFISCMFASSPASSSSSPAPSSPLLSSSSSVSSSPYYHYQHQHHHHHHHQHLNSAAKRQMLLKEERPPLHLSFPPDPRPPPTRLWRSPLRRLFPPRTTAREGWTSTTTPSRTMSSTSTSTSASPPQQPLAPHTPSTSWR